MELPRPRPLKKVTPRLLLVAATGAAVVSFANCGGLPFGNLMVRPTCQADGGPANCVPDVGSGDGGVDGGE